eukprot:Nitzschia sp. Nitz4//scaffold212_size37733//30472//32118//NITZ4_007740-RA/size37733-processed-gene-0.62-mRNA-1//1//CDS//3329542043//7641//frame0
MVFAGMASKNAAKNNNVIVMSGAGKPIFARYGTDEEIARVCGLIQALRTAIQGNSSDSLGEIQSIQASSLRIVFQTVGSITLVLIQSIGQNGIWDTEVFARLQLEYLYSQLIFTWTDHVQAILASNPGYDLKGMATPNDALLRGLMDEMGPNGAAGPFWSSGVQSMPLANKWRKAVSQALFTVGSKTQNLAFALVVAGDKLVALVQPSFRPHQLCTSDLLLILNFVNRQGGIVNSDLWMPMCLPRFNSTGFLHAFACSLDEISKLKLVLISSHNTPEQFQLLRKAALDVRSCLDIPLDADKIIVSESGSDLHLTSHDSADTTLRKESSDVEEDYVQVSMPSTAEEYPVLPPLLQEIRVNAKTTSMESLAKTYLDNSINSTLLLHFLFRYDAIVKPNSRRPGDKGQLAQCICPTPLPFPFTTTESRHRLWAYYQQLGLRLRLSAASTEAFQARVHDSVFVEPQDAFANLSKDCPATRLLESPPESPGVAYIAEKSEIFLAIAAPQYELYMVVSNLISTQEAAELGSSLIQRLTAQDKDLFLVSPLTWKE